MLKLQIPGREWSKLQPPMQGPGGSKAGHKGAGAAAGDGFKGGGGYGRAAGGASGGGWQQVNRFKRSRPAADAEDAGRSKYAHKESYNPNLDTSERRRRKAEWLCYRC